MKSSSQGCLDIVLGQAKFALWKCLDCFGEKGKNVFLRERAPRPFLVMLGGASSVFKCV